MCVCLLYFSVSNERRSKTETERKGGRACSRQRRRVTMAKRQQHHSKLSGMLAALPFSKIEGNSEDANLRRGGSQAFDVGNNTQRGRGIFDLSRPMMKKPAGASSLKPNVMMRKSPHVPPQPPSRSQCQPKQNVHPESQYNSQVLSQQYNVVDKVSDSRQLLRKNALLARQPAASGPLSQKNAVSKEQQQQQQQQQQQYRSATYEKDSALRTLVL